MSIRTLSSVHACPSAKHVIPVLSKPTFSILSFAALPLNRRRAKEVLCLWPHPLLNGHLNRNFCLGTFFRSFRRNTLASCMPPEARRGHSASAKLSSRSVMQPSRRSRRTGNSETPAPALLPSLSKGSPSLEFIGSCLVNRELCGIEPRERGRPRFCPPASRRNHSVC